MLNKMKKNIFFKLGASFTMLSTICNIIPVSASNENLSYSEKKIDSYLSSVKVNSNLEKQVDILNKIKNLISDEDGYIKNYNELKTLTKNNICVDEDSLKEFEDVKDLADLYSKNLTVNIFDENNLNYSLKNILNIILSNEVENTFFNSKFDKINSNSAIKNEIINLSNYLYINKDNSKDSQIFILKKLNEIEFLLKENSINENLISDFFNAMKKAYMVMISRRVSKELLNSEREKAMTFLQQASKSRNSSASAGLGYCGLSVGITANAYQNEGKSEKSFYEIEIGGGLSLSIGGEIGVGLGDLQAAFSANGALSGDLSTSTIFFSLEQFLDAQISKDLKEKSSSYLTSKTIKNLVLDRKNLKEAEKELLSCFQSSIEFYLKASNVVPTSVNMTWPKITKAFSPLNKTKKSLSGSVKAIAEVLNSSLGASTTITGRKIDQKINNSFITLINQDCSPNLGLTADEIIKELSEKGSICFNLKKDFEKLLIEDSYKEKSQRVLPVLLSQILGDIRQYNSVLSILSEKNSSDINTTKAKKIKKEIEKKWIGDHKIISRRGRERFLKTAIALSTYLRQFAEETEDIALFKQMYNELLHLVEMQHFSKNANTPHEGFKTQRSYKEYSISGNTSINVLDKAKASLNVTYLKTEDEPGHGDSDDINITINIPFVNSVLSGIDLIKKQLQKVQTDTPKNDFNMEEAFIKTSKVLDKAIGFTGIPSSLKIPGLSASTGSHLKLTFELTKVNKTDHEDSLIPIDGYEKTLNDKGTWLIKCIKASDVSDLNASLSGKVNTGSVNISGGAALNSTYTKSKKFKLGDECLAFPISRFCVAALCSKDSGDNPNTNYIWTSFKKSNKNEIYKMFFNIADNKSITYYQVQSMYNDIMFELKKSGEKEIEDICKKTFKDFIESCKNLKESDESSYNKALSLFEEVLDLNYKYNFCKKLNANWNLDSKKQKVIINY